MAYVKGHHFILALDIGTGETPNWVDFRNGVQSYGQAIADENQQYYYMAGGGAPETVNEGTSETFTISGHRNIGDAMQDWLFEHRRVWNLDPDIRKVPYRYYNTVDGKGEQGVVNISYNTTSSGNANERAVIGLLLSVEGVPEEYTHVVEGA